MKGLDPDFIENLRNGPIGAVYSIDVDDAGFFLGEGSFGKVVKASSKTTSDEVAVKVVDKRKLDEKGIVNIRREATIMKAMMHRNIVRCFEFYEAPTTVYFVMELITGKELYEKLKNLRTYTEEDARDLAKIVLTAIKYCHDKGIAHR
jgi:serine/threonine protein kinase